jgi:RNA polymerase sigma-70 factor (ECF subfamily)
LLSDEDQLAVIRGLREGKSNAWTTLYDGYSADVWRYVARLVGQDAGGVADVVQETFLAAARSARQFDPARGSVWAWLVGIAHHQVKVHWRQAARAARVKALAESGALEVLRWLDAPHDDFLERRELGDLVRSVLAELPSDYAALLAAKYMDDASLEELARQTSSSVEATKSKLARARREFRAKFEQMSREPSAK